MKELLNTSPYTLARSMCDVDKIVGYCFSYGIVISDGKVFFAALPVNLDEFKERSEKYLDKPDSWYVCIEVGDVKSVYKRIFQLKNIVYRRKNKLFVIDMKKAERIMHGE